MKKHIFKIISIFIIFIIMFNIVGCKKKNDNHQHDLKYYEKTKVISNIGSVQHVINIFLMQKEKKK